MHTGDLRLQLCINVTPELFGQVQSLACNSHPSNLWPCSFMLNFELFMLKINSCTHCMPSFMTCHWNVFIFCCVDKKTGSCRLFPTVIHRKEKRPTIPDGFFSSFILFPAWSTLHTHLHKMYPIMPHQPPGTMSFLTALDNGTQQTRTHAKQKTSKNKTKIHQPQNC